MYKTIRHRERSHLSFSAIDIERALLKQPNKYKQYNTLGTTNNTSQVYTWPVYCTSRFGKIKNTDKLRFYQHKFKVSLELLIMLTLLIFII